MCSELSCGCCELNPGLLEEQTVLWTTKPSLQAGFQGFLQLSWKAFILLSGYLNIFALCNLPPVLPPPPPPFPANILIVINLRHDAFIPQRVKQQWPTELKTEGSMCLGRDFQELNSLKLLVITEVGSLHIERQVVTSKSTASDILPSRLSKSFRKARHTQTLQQETRLPFLQEHQQPPHYSVLGLVTRSSRRQVRAPCAITRLGTFMFNKASALASLCTPFPPKL